VQPISPLPFLAVGLGIFALLGLGALYFHRLNRRLAARVLDWMKEGASPAEAQARLAASGIDAQYAADLVRKTVRRAAFDEANLLFDEGASEDEVVNHLVKGGFDAEAASDIVGAASLSRGLRRWPLLSIAAGLALLILGLAVGLFGLVLRDGNRTGRFVTFPYAGSITITIGTCIAGVGCTILYGRFTRSG
jgi:hypothetical protein